MGIYYDNCGFSSPKTLFHAINDGGNIAHINVLFSRIDRNPYLQAAYKECNRTNLETIARIYSGSGRVQGYADDIQNAYYFDGEGSRYGVPDMDFVIEYLQMKL